MASSAITGPVFTDVRRSPSGSAAAPSWSFADATGTGVYLASTDVLALSTAGVQRVVVDSAGNVGIGTESPTSLGTNIVVLDIKGKTVDRSGGIRLATSDDSQAGVMYMAAGLLFCGTTSSNPVAFQTAGTERMRINANGSLTIGTSSIATTHLIQGDYNDGAGVLDIRNHNTANSAPCMRMYTFATGTGTDNKFCNFLRGGVVTSGSIAANGANAVTFSTYSDRRLKENIVPLSGELSKVLALNPVEFDYKEGGHQIGFIAQEIEEIYPDVVSYVGPETETMKEIGGWDKTSARLVKAIQEQQAMIEELKAKVSALESK